MNQKREITIYDIARKLNISATTVSRGLKNHPTINKRTRERIADTARLMGYQTNNFASSLRSKKTLTLGVLVPNLNSYFMATVVAGMEDAANREGYTLLICQSQEQHQKEAANAHTMFNKRVDGLLVSLAYNTENIDHLAPFFNRGIPVVFFDRVFSHEGSTLIAIDNFKAAYNITNHLIEQGCRRIMLLAGNLLRDVYAERLRGYRKALEDAGLLYNDNMVYISNLGEAAGTAAAAHILNMPEGERPDGVFSSNDTAAVHCMINLISAGISIPADIAFVGFNNEPICKIIQPSLTTINYPGYTMGEVAVSNLIKELCGNGNFNATDKIILNSDLIVRNSSLKNKTL